VLCDICGQEKSDTRYLCGFSACGDCFSRETGGDIGNDESYTSDENRKVMRSAYQQAHSEEA